jgi:succinoglycan biosynthesis transport protein ExoP
MPDARREAANWLKPAFEQSGASRYLQTLRERAWLIVLTVLVTTGAAVAYVVTADDVYEAEADVLVTPVPPEDTRLAGLALLRDSADPSRDVETAARLITARDVEQKVEEKLGVTNPDVTAAPVADSNVVTITARASEPVLAQKLANGFAKTAIEKRTKDFHAQLDQAISSLRARVGEPAASDAQPGSPADELLQLESLRQVPDPTLRLETPAEAPESPSWPKPALSIAAGIIAGLMLGVGGVFGIQLLDPRLHREEDLRSLYNLPLLARIPAERARRKRGLPLLGHIPGIDNRGDRDRPDPLSPQHVSPAGVEAFRSLRFALAAAQDHREGSGSLLVTSASPGEGKTTVAVNLAASLALAGKNVVLIDADLRRPGVRAALGCAPPRHDIMKVLLEGVPLSEALVTADGFGGNLRALLADESKDWLADRLSLPAARELIGDAKELAEYVIIDSPPLLEVTDAVPLAQRADGVLLVVRLGSSHLDRLSRLGEMLAHQGITPVGTVLVGVSQPRRDYYQRPHQQPWLEQAREPREPEGALPGASRR